MRVIVSKQVRDSLVDFYAHAMQKHPTLDEVVVQAKIDRVLDGLNQLGLFPDKYPYARYKSEWIRQRYRDYCCEDIHFGYKKVRIETGEVVVVVFDACHSFLFHD